MKNMKIDDVIAMIKANDLIKKEEEKKSNPILWILAIVGAVAAIAAIAYLYFTPDYLEDFEDDFDDDFDDDFFEDSVEDAAAKDAE